MACKWNLFFLCRSLFEVFFILGRLLWFLALLANNGLSSHLKLCQLVRICVEFDRNIYIADPESGFVKLINRSLKGIVNFFSNLQALLVASNVHSEQLSTVTFCPPPN